MPVLVTGASGFLGGRLAEVLVQRGEQVTVLARTASDLRHLSAFVGGHVTVVRGGITERDHVTRAVREATHIFHCAAASTDWAPARVYLESNVNGTEMMLLAARDARFAMPEVTLGLPPAQIAPFVAARIGSAKALAAMLTGRRMDLKIVEIANPNRSAVLVAEDIADDFGMKVERRFTGLDSFPAGVIVIVTNDYQGIGGKNEGK